MGVVFGVCLATGLRDLEGRFVARARVGVGCWGLIGGGFVFAGGVALGVDGWAAEVGGGEGLGRGRHGEWCGLGSSGEGVFSVGRLGDLV